MSEIANGVYRARAVSGGLGETSTGKEQVAIECELMDSEGVVGPHITWFGYFTEKTTESTLRALRTFGWVGDDLANLTGIETNEVSLVIENEEYEGRVTPKVRWVNAPGGGGIGLKAPLAPDRAKSFAAKMRAAVRAFDIQTGNGKRPPAPKSRVGAVLSPEPPPMTDDPDIGF